MKVSENDEIALIFYVILLSGGRSMRKKIPSGVDDFGPIAKEGYYVDKTFIIPRILGYLEGTTILITRPRRFGKSLMVSMLDYFFSNSRGGKELFSSLFIKSDSVSMEEQGKYPVIRLTLKDAKQDSWDGMFALARRDLCFLARRFPELLDSSSLSAYQKEEFRQLCEEGSPNVVFDKSLLKLCELLHLHYGTKPILLVDEYDAPISKAYECGFYDKAIGFFRSLYGSALKGNEHLRFALVTGVMQIAKESLFSDLNNLCVDNVMEGPFSDCFGF